MSQEITLDDLLRKQHEMTSLTTDVQREKDAGRIQKIAAQLEVMGRELTALAKQFEEQELAKYGGPAKRGRTEVMLTPPQRERVRAATGIDIESVFIDDPAGITAKTMPRTDPAAIEAQAMGEAKKRKQIADTEAEVHRHLAATFNTIESQGTPALRSKLAELKSDPTFLGGFLQKK